VRQQELVIAYGVHESGRREVLGLDSGEAEAGPFGATSCTASKRAAWTACCCARGDRGGAQRQASATYRSSMAEPRIALAVIDLAGTTVRDDGAVEGALVDALRAVGKLDGEPGDELVAHLRDTMGTSKIEVFRDLVGDEGRAQEANTAFEAAYARRVEGGEVIALPGAEDAFRALRDAGVRVSLTTGFSAATRDLLIEALGWRDAVDLTLSPEGDVRGRPAPDLVLMSLMRLRLDDVRAVAVAGDTPNDLVCGHRAGASIVAGVLGGVHGRETLAQAPHTHLLESIADLPAVVAERR